MAAHVPGLVPDRGGELFAKLGVLVKKPLLEERASVEAQSLVMEQELAAGRHPLAAIGAESAARDEIVDVGMEDQRAAPGVEHAQHAQLGAESARVGGQILEGLGAASKEQIQRDLQLRADEPTQRLGHGEGDQEVGRGQKQALALALQPGVGVGLAAERTVPVVAGMITVVKAVTVGAGEEFSAQGRGAAGQDRVQDLSLPGRHGGAEAPEVIRGQAPEPLVNGEALATGGGRLAHRSPMKSSRRFWCWVLQRLVRWV